MGYFWDFSPGGEERVQALADASWGLMRGWIHLIASASYPFPQVLDALSNPLCAFPIEGLPGERFFPGTDTIDRIETRSEEILRYLFDADDYRATIQPHSGTQANQVVFNAVLNPKDTVLSVSPKQGGHVSHTVLLGRRNKVVYYPVGPDGRIDLMSLEGLAREVKPKLIIAGGSALPREVDFAAISAVARRNGSLLHADISHTASFVAAGAHKAVTPHVDFITFNMVKNLRGPAGGVLIYRKEHHSRVSKALFPDTQGGPNESVLFAKYVALELLDKPRLAVYTSKVVTLARTMAALFQDRGLAVVTGGTDCHIVLVDVSATGKTGVEVEKECEAAHILLNRNLVPGDLRGPGVTSGVRIGTACLAILGYTEHDARTLAAALVSIVRGDSTGAYETVRELTLKYNEQVLRSKPPVG